MFTRYGCLQVRYDEALPVCPSSVTCCACNIQLCPCVFKQIMITCPRRVLGRVHSKLQCHAILANFCFPSAPPFESAIVLVIAMPTTDAPTATTVASLPVPVATGTVSGACWGAAFASPQFPPILRLGIRLPFKSERF